MARIWNIIEHDDAEMAAAVARTLQGFDQDSVAIMVPYVLAYADSTRPTLVDLYGRYYCDITRYNKMRRRERMPTCAVLSRRTFQRAVDALDPCVLLIRRHGRYVHCNTIKDRNNSTRSPDAG